MVVAGEGNEVALLNEPWVKEVSRKLKVFCSK